ncbi:MAG: response regulator [Acidobacteriota bacterium]
MTGYVMVVEDDENTLSGYLEFLRSAGFDPAGVGDGAEALRMAFEHPPAAVVTDIALPGMSGFALATALHHDSRTRDVPVIGLTAHWGVDVRGRAAECRMRAVLAKPCLPAHLVAELLRVLSAPGPTSGPILSQASDPTPGSH